MKALWKVVKEQNVICSIADFVNKIAFVLSCWFCAKEDSAGKTDALLG